MQRLLAILRSPAVRAGFLLLAFGLGAWLLVAYWGQFSAAVARVRPVSLIAAIALSIAHVFLMMCSWRAVLAGLGSRLSVPDAGSMYWVGQVGKYIPGGVWNFLASAELGADRDIPRRSSVAAMSIAMMVSVLTALAIGCLAFLYAPGPLLRQVGWVVWFILPLAVCLFPPVLNRLIELVFRLAKLPEPPRRLGAGTLAAAIGLSALGWLAAGAQMWVLAGDLSLPLSAATLIMTTAVSALASAAGLLFIPAPSGAVVREGVVFAALAGGGMTEGAVLALVILTRVTLVLADLALAVVGLLIARAAGRRTART